MRGTTKPCHGCGETKHRSADAVCADCRAMIRAGWASQGRPENKEGVIYRLGGEWPAFYSPGGNTKVLGEAMLQVAVSVLERDGADPYGDPVLPLPPPSGEVHYFSTWDKKASSWRDPKGAGGALIVLDLEIRRQITAAYEEGKRTGSSLLMSIARGDISVNELTRASIEENRQ